MTTDRARVYARPYWRGYTTWGAVTSIVVGGVSSLVLISISPTIMVDVLERDRR